ncbi:DUF5806 family protein [Natrinema sp. 1APR25-10V2]|uniref:DUF5806 family protein n=1 Tax=Natrinema sp. 1APR25-10V2 TaxID=2951081 RepID=UPI002874E793|nr:DUF5806 family protein [Natrinema sp. 1APR25-10V2]MDS0474428.1 DUF5806 family protein [Natrinema sp. 1APR25-10V2]
MPDESTSTDGESTSKYAGNPDGERFTKIRTADYDRVNEFLKERTAFTAREWAIARACQDFRTPTGVPMQTVGKHLPEIVPFMEEAYSGQSVSSAKYRFDEKVQRAANTMLYGALSGFYTADELDEILYEAVETATLLIETEGGTIDLETEQRVESELAAYMNEVRATSREVSAQLVAESESGDGAADESVD